MKILVGFLGPRVLGRGARGGNAHCPTKVAQKIKIKKISMMDMFTKI